MTRIALVGLSAFAALFLSGHIDAHTNPADDEKVAIVITEGHETDPRDHGRPVILIAHALGVTSDVFRDAFSRVRPAAAGVEPDPVEVRRNKSVLLDALTRFGVSNERLDEVSNYYRYRPGNDRLWTTRPAAGFVTLKDGAVVTIVVTDPGAGYSSAPRIVVPGHPEIKLQATPTFSLELAKNGSLSSITRIP